MGTHSPVNQLQSRFETDDVALGVLENTYSPTLVEFYGELGVDFVWIDLEHGGPSPSDGATIENLLRAAERAGTEILLRLPDSEPASVRKVLDLGVRNVFLPRAESVKAVRAAIRASRFRYEDEPGERGLASPRARRWGLADDYIATQDSETLVGVTIETRTGLDNLSDLLEIPELGFVFIGPVDLSVSLGYPGEMDHPEVQQAVERVRSATVEAGVPLGGLGFGMDDVNRKAEQGYQLLNLGSTTGALTRTITDWIDAYDGERPDGS